MEVTIHPEWKKVLQEEFNMPYMQEIKEFLLQEREKGQTVYPRGSQIFRAFDTCPFHSVKVVVIGQDPYHGKGQANGLCFSVNQGMALPPSLQNIYKELHNDLSIPIPNHGDLTSWAEQGVLLLNASLTVRAHTPNSHSQIGWQQFTDAVINILSEQREHLVFVLWGSFAQKKAEKVDPSKHLILKSAHPSPFSVERFWGNHHFSKANTYLEENGLSPIDWEVKNRSRGELAFND